MTSAVEHLDPGDELLPTPEFARIAGLAESQVRELLDYQLLAPARLDMRTAFALREAGRIGRDFDLDLFTIGLLAGYLERIGSLESEVRSLRAEHTVRPVYTEVTFTSVELRRRH